MDALNMLGKTCPVPVIEAKKALAQAAPGSQVQVLVDNDVARQNLSRLAAKLGCAFQYEAKEAGQILATFTLPAGPLAQKAAEGAVVAISGATMGRGDEKLGGMLMKSFVYSLTELDPPPETVLFFNGGVQLACEGAATLDDLRALEEKGVQLAACGACLDFYGLKEKLAVGHVTNMYAIASSMAAAAHLINL